MTPCPSALFDLSLILGIIRNPSQQARVIGLSGHDAQCVADYFSVFLHEDGAFSSGDGKHLLSLLQKLVKSAEVLPQCYELREVRCDFSQAREGGSFADIFQGVYRNQKVCVKAVRIFQRGDNTRMLKACAKEIVLWAHLSHENILPFYGIHQGASGRICMISPWVDSGDLSVYLQNFPHTLRQPLVLGVTAGLQYLHQSDIVHGDLKAKNILVSKHGRALIADFGISRIVSSTKLASTQLSCGTMRWMAPELLMLTDDGENCPLVTLQSDIWSLGCVYYEILTRKVPFYHCTNDARLSLLRSDPKVIPHRPTDGHEVDNISDDMWRLMERCWDSEPSSRPSCNDVQAFITDILGVLEPRSAPRVAPWKAVRGGSDIRAISKRARRILCPQKEIIVIAFMGLAGTGKSFFIDLLTGASEQDRHAGNTLKSVISQVEATTIFHPDDKTQRIILVDTPGLENSPIHDMQILQMVGRWLQNMYNENITLSGLIYLHRITDIRVGGNSRYNSFRLFQTICEDLFMNQVLLVSTMWGNIKPGIGEAREDELKKRFWEPLIRRGSGVERLAKTESDEAWRIVNKLIESYRKGPQKGIVQSQGGLVGLGIRLHESQAGRMLCTSLQRQLADQKDALKSLLVQVEKSNDPALTKVLVEEYDRIEADFQRTFEEVKKFKVSLGTKIAGMFGGKKAKAKAVKIGEV